MMVLGLLVNGFIVQAAEQKSCDHTNIHSFDTGKSSSYDHIYNGKVCHVVVEGYFTTYYCLDCGTVVDTIDHTSERHSLH